MTRFTIFFSLFLLAACLSTPPQPLTQKLRLGTRHAPDSINPYLSTNVTGEIIAARLFPTLFIEEPFMENGVPKLSPLLVDHFQWDETGLILTLQLKEGLAWSDGTPVTSADVAFSLEMGKDPDVAWLSTDLYARIEGWTSLSSQQIEIRFLQVSPFNLLDINTGFIIPKHHFGRWPPSEWRTQDWVKDLVYFGPYRITNYREGESLVLESLIPGDVPTLGFAFIREKETLYNSLLNGDLDFAWELPVERITAIETRLEPVIYSNLTFAYIGWNPIRPDAWPEEGVTTVAALEKLKKEAPHPLFADARVRRAMTYAFNRENYIRRFWAGKTEVPLSPWQAGLAYHHSGLQPRSHSIEQAEQLLAETGWVRQNGVRMKNGTPFRFSVICNAGSPIREHYLLAIQRDLELLGIQMEIDLQEGGRYLNNCLSRRYDAYFGIFRTGTRPDLASLYHGEASLGGYNFTSWTAVDNLLEQVRDAETTEELGAGLVEMEHIFHEDQPITLLFKGQTIGARRKNMPKPQSNYLDPLFQVETWFSDWDR